MVPSTLYSASACTVKVIVPLCTAHVGCTALSKVGTAGTAGIASIVMAAPTLTQVVSFLSLTLTV